VTIENYFPEVGNIPRGRRTRGIFPTEGKYFSIVTDNISNYVFCYTSNNHKIRRKQIHNTSNNDVIVHFVRSVYYLDTLELIKYYLAIKVSSNAVRNIYTIRNLSIS